MTDVKELFHAATERVRPDPGALQRQYGDQRRRAIRRKAGIYGLVSAIALIGVLVAIATFADRPGGSKPAHQPPKSSGLTPQTVEIVGLDGTTRRLVTGLPADAYGLDLSSDGSTIAFVTTPPGDISRIGTVGIDGSDLHVITGLRLVATDPEWSPDGSRLVFQGLSPEGNSDIYVMNADGGNLRRLTTDPGIDEWPSWSPDGSTIVYDNVGAQPLNDSGFSPTSEIMTIPSEGGTPTQLTRNTLGDSEPAYSPDGSQIAFHEDGTIWVMDSNGKRRRMVVTIRCCNFTPVWSPDGSRIAFTRYDDSWRAIVPMGGVTQDRPVVVVYLVDVQTGRWSDVGGASMATDGNTPQWLPTGDALLLNRLEHP